MLPNIPRAVSPDVRETLQQLHARMTDLGHHLAWFIDMDGNVRLLVSVESGQETFTYQAGDERHDVMLPGQRHSADLDLSIADARLLGVGGMICMIEKRMGLVLVPDLAAERRVA